MKKIIYLLCIILLTIISFQCKGEKTKNREGIINFITGEVDLILRGSKISAKVGDIVTPGMKIITGKKSFADIYFGENAIKILESTVFEISELSENLKLKTEQTEFYIEKGKVFSKVSKKLSKGDKYTVKTPTTIAGVRGTDFLVTEENGKANIACLNGKVAVRDASQPDSDPVELNSGEEVDVEKGDELMVKSLTDENKKNIQDILDNFKEMRADIREKFEKQRDEIRKTVIDQKDRDKEMVEKQKAEIKKDIEEQKEADKERIEKIKGNTNDGQKPVREDITRQKEESKKALEGVKPKIKKTIIKKPKI